MLRLLFIVNLVLIIVCIYLTFKAFPKQKRKIIILLTSVTFTALIFLIIYPNFISYGFIRCEDLLQMEANNVAASISDYFSDPSHNKTPTINDLVDWGSYVPPEKRKPRRRYDSVKESDLIIFISGDVDDEIEIWVIAAEGQCPEGKAYVYSLYRQEGKWLDSYKEN
jgi:hypothetical protein